MFGADTKPGPPFQSGPPTRTFPEVTLVFTLNHHLIDGHDNTPDLIDGHDNTPDEGGPNHYPPGEFIRGTVFIDVTP